MQHSPCPFDSTGIWSYLDSRSDPTVLRTEDTQAVDPDRMPARDDEFAVVQFELDIDVEDAPVNSPWARAYAD